MWNKEALLKHLPNLVEDILHLHPSTTGAEDGYAWLLNPSGEYTSKSGYLALHLEKLQPNKLPTFHMLGVAGVFGGWFKSTSKNLLIFENISFTPTSTMSKEIVAAREWSLAQTLAPPPETRSLDPTAQSVT
ncbi:uncharacterized protein LOC108834620 [Raphanus sativus]|uniref:Uncharacterized protein LOC108834620 n=1 Tax=Raphanus sativus TaxID=3726 RepID=A0A6J0LVP8_RAPSA|nr:uncharacterized protein LOC108834620 [Raphanus sativus]